MSKENNNITRIEVKSSEYKINKLEKNKVLFTNHVEGDIVLIAYSVALEKIAMGRNLNEPQLISLFKEFNDQNLIQEGLIEVRIAGGNSSDQSIQACSNLLQNLNNIDNETDIITVVGVGVNDQLHPDSFGVDCYNGVLTY